MKLDRPVVCIGGGPAGLTAAYLLSKEGVPVIVLESDPEHVGGIARTVSRDGFYFDIGGHRFFSKSPEVEALWTELLGADLLERPRSSRIYYRRRFFSYPLKGLEALIKLGIIESALCVLSYVKAKLFPKRPALSFEDWVSNEFGSRLYRIFFKTYTEKVWGMPCSEISADWAAQRIHGLSLARAAWEAVRPRALASREERHRKVKTLIDTFRYPRRGPGMLWQAAADRIRERGGELRLGARATGVERLGPAGSGLWRVRYRDLRTGREESLEASHVISSAPIRELLEGLSPAPRALESARGLGYRDFLTVALMVKDRGLFTDNWIYIHDPAVQVGRIQNFKSWSPEMVPDPALNCLGLEYFCFEGDGLWGANDSELIALAKRELIQIGIIEADDVLSGCVVRQPKAYPVYDQGYQERVAAVREELERDYPGLHLVGRNGMHKYNNQDHAMMTAMLTVKNILAGRTLYDVWRVNQDAQYLEEGERGDSGLRQVPRSLSQR